MSGSLRLVLLGVGAMKSPRYAPAGLLVEYGAHRVMLDGGAGAEPAQPIDAWLVTDDRGELMQQIRQFAKPEVSNRRFHASVAMGWSSRPSRSYTPRTQHSAI